MSSQQIVKTNNEISLAKSVNDNLSKEFIEVDKKLQIVLKDNNRMKEEFNKITETQKQLIQIIQNMNEENNKLKNLVSDIASSAGGYYETKIDNKIQDDFKKLQLKEFKKDGLNEYDVGMQSKTDSNLNKNKKITSKSNIKKDIDFNKFG